MNKDEKKQILKLVAIVLAFMLLIPFVQNFFKTAGESNQSSTQLNADVEEVLNEIPQMTYAELQEKLQEIVEEEQQQINPGTEQSGTEPGTEPGTEQPGTEPGTEQPGTEPGTEPGTDNPGQTTEPVVEKITANVYLYDFVDLLIVKFKPNYNISHINQF